MKKDETKHLLRSKKNADRLIAAIKSSRAGEGKRMTLRELRREMNLTRRKTT